MIALSSHRRLADSPEVAKNQIRANLSWRKVFEEIVYFGPPERELADRNVTFVKSDDFPTLRTLARAASLCDDYVCLLNADIVVTPGLIAAIRDVWAKGGLVVTSRRYEFKGIDHLVDAQLVDPGVDFFGATPDYWRDFANAVPANMRVGHSGWDSWAMGFFNTVAAKRFWDITKRKVIFHPKHGSRKRSYEIEIKNDEFTRQAGLPYLRL